MKKIYSCSLLLCWALLAHAEEVWTEQTRQLSRTYAVQPGDRLQVANQYGQVKVELWERSEISIQISIRGMGRSVAEAQRYADAVTIAERRQNRLISLETRYQPDKSGFQGSDNQQGVRIDYVVRMPRYVPLDLRNRFGDAVIPEFSAALQVATQYGSLRANRLSGPSNRIDVSYGRCVIGSLNQADIHMAYSALELLTAERLRLQNTYGTVNISKVGDLDASLHYAAGRIGQLTDQGTMSISYSAAMTLPMLAETVRRFDLTCNHTKVQIPVGGEASFDVTVSNGLLAYPVGMPISFTFKDDGRHSGGNVRIYRGTIGKNEKAGKSGGTPVRVVSSYGSVNFIHGPAEAVPPGPTPAGKH